MVSRGTGNTSRVHHFFLFCYMNTKISSRPSVVWCNVVWMHTVLFLSFFLSFFFLTVKVRKKLKKKKRATVDLWGVTDSNRYAQTPPGLRLSIEGIDPSPTGTVGWSILHSAAVSRLATISGQDIIHRLIRGSLVTELHPSLCLPPASFVGLLLLN